MSSSHTRLAWSIRTLLVESFQMVGSVPHQRQSRIQTPNPSFISIGSMHQCRKNTQSVCKKSMCKHTFLVDYLTWPKIIWLPPSQPSRAVKSLKDHYHWSYHQYLGQHVLTNAGLFSIWTAANVDVVSDCCGHFTFQPSHIVMSFG